MLDHLATPTRSAFAVVVLLAIAVIGSPARADDEPVPVPVPAPAAEPAREADLETVTWFDGNRRRTAWVSRDLIAEFLASDDAESVVLRAVPGVKPVPLGTSVVRIWKLPVGTSVAAAIASVLAIDAKGRVSEVCHDHPGRAAPIRALPGGIVLQLPRDWDAARLDTWLDARLLTIDRTLDLPNTFVVHTKSGLSSLALANSLCDAGEVAAASPDWWTERIGR